MLGFIGETIGKIFGTDKAAGALINNVSSGWISWFIRQRKKQRHRLQPLPKPGRW